MDQMTNQTETTLKDLVKKFNPRSILVIGPVGEEFFAHYVTDPSRCRMDVLAVEDIGQRLDTLGRYDLVFVSHVLERLDKTAAGNLISKLRDLHGSRLIMVVPIGTDWHGHASLWEKIDLLGYGLVQVGGYMHQGRPVHIYAYDIATYKTTPDWLNARYWAHPELFNKHWW
jgi:hypothetical protein